jgi:hypothetical protein
VGQFFIDPLPKQNPWWASPNVWTTNQNGPAGSTHNNPQVNNPARLSANITWSGSSDTDYWPVNGYVDFYISLPYSGSFDPGAATTLFHSRVPIAPGSFRAPDTLEVDTPGFVWTPDASTGTHQCLIAEAYAPHVDDWTGPIGSDYGTTDIPSDRHAAQLNLAIIPAAPRHIPPYHFHFIFYVTPAFPFEKSDVREYSLTVRIAQQQAIEGLRTLLPRDLQHRTFDGKLRDLGITDVLERDEDCDLDDYDGPLASDVEIPHAPKLIQRRAVVGSLAGGDGAIIHIAQHLGKRPIGGIAMVVLGPE